MKLYNEQGQAVYFNKVNKHDKTVYIIKALDGQSIPNRDRRPQSSRTFTRLSQAEAWLTRNNYNN